jgi:hypothetical protein
MNRLKLLLSTHAVVLSSLAAVGCAGTLSTDEADALRLAHTTGGAGGGSPTPGTGGMSGSGNAGAGGADPAACVITLSNASCTICHGDTLKYAGLDLAASAIMNAKQTFVDKPGQGDPPGMMTSCGMAGVNLKLIDSAAPDKSLLYTKLNDAAPCGVRMPQVGMALTPNDKACVLTWIKSVVGAPTTSESGDGG